ncbi:MAG: SH3 domain-containing protein [Litoreibacter sp.]|nr:SH3 domain-containing protein [Litoreibacter sp.]MCY4335598.1 SH3 domain-containing protein [Litoreibacter sp.]
MFKWVTGLCAAIYLTLLVFGAPPEGEELAALTTDEVPLATGFVALEPEPISFTSEPIVETPAPVAEKASEAPVSVTQLPSTQPSKPVEVSKTPITPEPIAEPDPNGVGEIWQVTGSRVNLRKAATTRASVVGQTLKGERAEVLELLDTGWARVFIIESGIEAYMSAKFIIREG